MISSKAPTTHFHIGPPSLLRTTSPQVASSTGPVVGPGDHGWYPESPCGALGHRPPLPALLRGPPQSPVKEVQSSKE